jgi:hypothetical protein
VRRRLAPSPTHQSKKKALSRTRIAGARHRMCATIGKSSPFDVAFAEPISICRRSHVAALKEVRVPCQSARPTRCTEATRATCVTGRMVTLLSHRTHESIFYYFLLCPVPPVPPVRIVKTGTHLNCTGIERPNIKFRLNFNDVLYVRQAVVCLSRHADCRDTRVLHFRAICATMSKAAARKVEPPVSETDILQFYQIDRDTFVIVDMAAVGVKAWHLAGILPTTHGRPHDQSEIIALATAMKNIVLELLPPAARIRGNVRVVTQ